MWYICAYGHIHVFIHKLFSGLPRSCRTLLKGCKLADKMADAGRDATPEPKPKPENVMDLFDGLLASTYMFPECCTCALKTKSIL